jgi:hypothetical protein
MECVHEKASFLASFSSTHARGHVDGGMVWFGRDFWCTERSLLIKSSEKLVASASRCSKPFESR